MTSIRKGIILAGGRGERLAPATRTMNKHMIPIVDTPMVVYPLITLRDVFGIKDILIVSGGNDLGAFTDFLGDGSAYGVSLTYRVQKEAGGIAQALFCAEAFAAGEPCAVILGDNIFENQGVRASLGTEAIDPTTAHLFIKEVPRPNRFGVVAFDEQGIAKTVIEKPAVPPSSFAVTGLYVFPSDVFSRLSSLTPSMRGEYEITDINNAYLAEGRARVRPLSGFWSDAGTPESLSRAVAWVSFGRGY
jgi:glucose-1-phosphate thymidylyltransferase